MGEEVILDAIVSFPAMDIRKTATVSCPAGYTGTITRTCTFVDTSPTWGSADSSDCTGGGVHVATPFVSLNVSSCMCCRLPFQHYVFSNSAMHVNLVARWKPTSMEAQITLTHGWCLAPTDIDGCVNNTCTGGATCNDVPAPGMGYTCSCDAGYMEVDGTCVGRTPLTSQGW